jgi:hypothetical protein
MQLKNFDLLCEGLYSFLVNVNRLIKLEVPLVIENLKNLKAIELQELGKKAITRLVELVENLSYLDDDCAVFEQLGIRMKEAGHGGSAEGVKAFASLRETLKLVQPPVRSKCESMRDTAPEWVRALLFGAETSACKIVNRRFNEVLVLQPENDAAAAGLSSVYTTTAGEIK